MNDGVIVGKETVPALIWDGKMRTNLREVIDPSEFRDGIKLVLVHQMGKVGSGTIYHSIQDSRTNVKVWHSHFLSDGFAAEVRSMDCGTTKPLGLEDIPALSEWFRWALKQREKILADMSVALPMSMCVITGFRHLCDFVFSLIFQIVPFFFPHLSYRPELCREELGMLEQWWLKVLWLFRNSPGDRYHEAILAKHVFSRHLWFEEEFRQVFGIDAYALPITKRDVYAFTDGTRLYVIYRYEKFLENFNKILSYVVAPQDIRRVDINLSDDKPYGNLYREFRKSVVLPHDVDQFLRHTTYSRHFYGENTDQRERPRDYDLLRMETLRQLDLHWRLAGYALTQDQTITGLREQQDQHAVERAELRVGLSAREAEVENLRRELGNRERMLMFLGPEVLHLAKSRLFRRWCRVLLLVADLVAPSGSLRRAWLKRLASIITSD